MPYYLAPATLGFVLDKRLKKRKEDTKPEKLAMILNKEKAKEVGKVTVEKAAEGLGRTIFPAIFTATTGKNIMNSLKDVRESDSNTRQEDMANKIVIHINEGSKKSIKRQVSKELDSVLKKTASSKINDIVQLLRDENSLIKDKKKLQGTRIKFTNNVRKQFKKHKMHEMHGQNPMV